MNILCVYRQNENEVQVSEGEILGEIGREHCVLVAHNYNDASDYLRNSIQKGIHFDIVMTDQMLLLDQSYTRLDPFGRILKDLALNELVSGIGTFFPPTVNRHVASKVDGFHVLLESSVCYTSEGGRDWKMMFQILTKGVENVKACAENLVATGP